MIKRLWTDSQKARFLILGAWNTLFGFGVFALGYFWLKNDLHYLVIATIAHALAVLNAFVLQRWFVFQDRGPAMPAFLRFNVATTISLLFSLAGMVLLVDGVGLDPIVSQALVTLLSVIGTYVLHRHYTFRQQNTG
jgi:putative flippase GtrA